MVARGLGAVDARGRTRTLPVALDWRPEVNQESVLVHAGRLFSGSGEGYRADVDLLIENGRIVSMAGHREHPRGVAVLDGKIYDRGLVDFIDDTTRSIFNYSNSLIATRLPSGSRAYDV